MIRLLLILFVIGMFSCTKRCDDSCCGEKPGKSYELVSIVGVEGRAFNRVDYENWVPDTTNPIQFDHLRIEIYCKTKYVALHFPTPLRHFEIIPSAYACSPVIEQLPVNKLTNLRVESNNDYNNEFPVGENLESLFTDYRGRSMFDVFNEDFGADFGLSLKPENSNIHQFTIHFEYDDTLTYSFKLPAVFLI